MLLANDYHKAVAGVKAVKSKLVFRALTSSPKTVSNEDPSNTFLSGQQRFK